MTKKKPKQNWNYNEIIIIFLSIALVISLGYGLAFIIGIMSITNYWLYLLSVSLVLLFGYLNYRLGVWLYETSI